MTWSRDGTRITYSGGPGGGSVYSIDVQTGEHSLLVGRSLLVQGGLPLIDWSSDGKHLAITYEERRVAGDFPDSLYLANADGSAIRLVDGDVAWSSWPDWHPGLSVGSAWSPDGTRLAYSSLPGGTIRQGESSFGASRRTSPHHR